MAVAAFIRVVVLLPSAVGVSVIGSDMECTANNRFPCGQCLSCRINARRIWAARIMLESQCHEHSSFITLTYEVPPDGQTVVKSHLSQFMHSVRKRARNLGTTGVRFYGVGEYGEIGARPHYHAAIFGLSPQQNSLLCEAWAGMDFSDVHAKPGLVHIGILNPDSAGYIAGYVTKKLTKKDDPRLNGRDPEFAVMSRRPGIGAPYLQPLIDALNTSFGALFIAQHHDVPVAFSCGGKVLPLGSYLRTKLRIFFFGDHYQPQAAKEQKRADLQARFERFMPAMPVDSKTFSSMENYFVKKELFKKRLQVTKVQRALNVQAKHKISNSRKTL